MYIPKRYGQSKIEKCPFCDKHATTSNSQGVPVCTDHKEELLDGLKCACGEYLEVRSGKFGAYFNCINCGNINMRKALEINETRTDAKPKVIESPSEKIESYKKSQAASRPKETTVRSDDPDYF